MSIAEKLLAVADNMPKVYEKGYSEGYEKGKAERIDYLPYITTLRMSADFSTITEDVTLNLERATTIADLFNGVTINTSKVTVKITDKCTSFLRAFLGNNGYEPLEEIEIIGDTSKVTTFAAVFQSRKNLERVIGELDFSGVTSSSGMIQLFHTSNNVKEFYPKAGTIKFSVTISNLADLTDECIQAIVDGFADMTGQTAPVLTFHADVKARVVADDEKEDTDLQKRNWLRTLTNKNVTLA